MTDRYDPDRDDAQPGNATPLEISIAQTTGRLDDLDMDLAGRVGSSDIAEVPEPFLAHRAWSRSVDVYDPVWPVEIRRAVIEVAPEVHLHRGELYAVRTALAALRVDTEVVQWWQTEPKGRPYTFEVRAYAQARLYDGPLLDNRLVRVVYTTVNRTKPLSRAFDLRVVAGTSAGLALTAATVVRARVGVALRPEAREDFASEIGLTAVHVVRGRINAVLACRLDP